MQQWLTNNRGVGLVLVLVALGVDTLFTLKGMQIPALVAGVATAGLGLVTASQFSKKSE